VLVHGAGSGPWVYEGWEHYFPGVTVDAIDLQEELDVSKAFPRRLCTEGRRYPSSLPGPTSLCGWSMGGLVVLQATPAHKPPQCRAARVERTRRGDKSTTPTTELVDGSFDPEVVYGPFPGRNARSARIDSRPSERKRGISVPTLPCRHS